MKRKRDLYAPVKEQFLMMVEYINILEMKNNGDQIHEIVFLLEMLNTVKRQSELYLNFELVCLGENYND